MSNSVKRKLIFKKATGNNMTNDQMYAQIKNKVSGLEKKLQMGTEKRKKYKFILNSINTEIEYLESQIQEGKSTLKNFNNINADKSRKKFRKN